MAPLRKCMGTVVGDTGHRFADCFGVDVLATGIHSRDDSFHTVFVQRVVDDGFDGGHLLLECDVGRRGSGGGNNDK